MRKSNVIASLRKQRTRSKRTFDSVVLDLIHSSYISNSLSLSKYIVYISGIAAITLQHITKSKI